MDSNSRNDAGMSLNVLKVYSRYLDGLPRTNHAQLLILLINGSSELSTYLLLESSKKFK